MADIKPPLVSHIDFNTTARTAAAYVVLIRIDAGFQREHQTLAPCISYDAKGFLG
jgi:hypothetical protein